MSSDHSQDLIRRMQFWNRPINSGSAEPTITWLMSSHQREGLHRDKVLLKVDLTIELRRNERAQGGGDDSYMKQIPRLWEYS